MTSLKHCHCLHLLNVWKWVHAFLPKDKKMSVTGNLVS